MPDKIEISFLLEKLRECYGPRRLVPHFDPTGEMILTILSQNTSDTNSRPAFKALKDSFSNWEELMNADTVKIEALINRGGLAHIKAERIKKALGIIKEKTGALTLSNIKEMTVEEGREWLTNLPGVGVKTANCVLLFALGKPAMPVDTHVYRVTSKLGLIPEKTAVTEAHKYLEAIVPDDNTYEFHVLVIEHGRHVCSARNPKCNICAFAAVCPGSTTVQSYAKEKKAWRKK